MEDLMSAILGHRWWTFYSRDDRASFGIVWNISTICSYQCFGANSYVSSATNWEVWKWKNRIQCYHNKVWCVCSYCSTDQLLLNMLCRVFLVRILNLYALMAGWFIATEVCVCMCPCLCLSVCLCLCLCCVSVYVSAFLCMWASYVCLCVSWLREPACLSIYLSTHLRVHCWKPKGKFVEVKAHEQLPMWI